MLTFFQRLHEAVDGPISELDKPSYRSIARGLDSWGVTEGALLEEACEISEAVRQLIEGETGG